MELKELTKRTYMGERLLDDVLDALLDKKYHSFIKEAIKAGMPFMIYDSGEGGDGLLYRALKNEGVKTVKSFRIDREMQKENTAENSVFFTVYLNRKIDKSYYC